jgi:hypothetical protein
MAAKKTVKKLDKPESKAAKTEGPAFKCRFCGETKPFDEMRIMTRFFPQVIACRVCEKKMQ